MATTTARRARTAKTISIASTLDRDGEPSIYGAAIVPGQSITVTGEKATGEHRLTGYWANIRGYLSGMDHAEHGKAYCWLHRLCHENRRVLGGLIHDSHDIAGDWIEENGGNRSWVEFFMAHPQNEAVYGPTSATYSIGDSAEYHSYNLSYMGCIVSITEKTVTIRDRGNLKHRLSIHEFAWRNHDGLAAKLKNNAEWTD